MAGPGSTSAATRIPAFAGARPDLKDKVTIPDVLLQPHSAPLGLTFYDGNQFPGGLSRRCLRRCAWLMEQVAAHRLQGHSHPP